MTTPRGATVIRVERTTGDSGMVRVLSPGNRATLAQTYYPSCHNARRAADVWHGIIPASIVDDRTKRTAKAGV